MIILCLNLTSQLSFLVLDFGQRWFNLLLLFCDGQGKSEKIVRSFTVIYTGESCTRLTEEAIFHGRRRIFSSYHLSLVGSQVVQEATPPFCGADRQHGWRSSRQLHNLEALRQSILYLCYFYGRLLNSIIGRELASFISLTQSLARSRFESFGPEAAPLHHHPCRSYQTT